VDALECVMQAHVVGVHQIFSGGPVAGDALLMLNASGASRLTELLTNEPALPLAIDASAREVITEAANILLNACLGTFGPLLNPQVSYSVPHLEIANLGAILQPLMAAQQGLRYALIVHAGFRLGNGAVAGYLLIVLSVASLDRLMHAVDELEKTQS
jgi:chemotaxis protein CheC